MLHPESYPLVTERPVLDHCRTPESLLLLAVLHDALETYQRGLRTRDGASIKAFREVDRWFRSEDYDWPFAFESICSAIGVDAGHIRDGLNRLKCAFVLDPSTKKTRMVAKARLATGRNDQSPPLGLT